MLSRRQKPAPRDVHQGIGDILTEGIDSLARAPKAPRQVSIRAAAKLKQLKERAKNPDHHTAWIYNVPPEQVQKELAPFCKLHPEAHITSPTRPFNSKSKNEVKDHMLEECAGKDLFNKALDSDIKTHASHSAYKKSMETACRKRYLKEDKPDPTTSSRKRATAPDDEEEEEGVLQLRPKRKRLVIVSDDEN